MAMDFKKRKVKQEQLETEVEQAQNKPMATPLKNCEYQCGACEEYFKIQYFIPASTAPENVTEEVIQTVIQIKPKYKAMGRHVLILGRRGVGGDKNLAF